MQLAYVKLALKISFLKAAVKRTSADHLAIIMSTAVKICHCNHTLPFHRSQYV